MRKGLKLDRRFYRYRDEQQVLVKECIKLSKYYEQSLQVNVIEKESIEMFRHRLISGNHIDEQYFDILLKLLNQIKEQYEAKLFNFYKNVDKDFMKYYDQNVNKFISNPEIFEWLGLLDIEYVYQ